MNGSRPTSLAGSDDRVADSRSAGALTRTETKAGIHRRRLIDRNSLVRLAWDHGHPYPPEYSSVNLALFLRRRGVGVFR